MCKKKTNASVTISDTRIESLDLDAQRTEHFALSAVTASELETSEASPAIPGLPFKRW